MRQDLETKISSATTLLDVLMILKDVIALDTHVATLAYVEEVYQEYNAELGYGILRCNPFPLDKEQEEYTIQAYFFKNNNFNDRKYVVILFMDRNFINNLTVVDGKPKETKDLSTHSLKFGVVMETM